MLRAHMAVPWCSDGKEPPCNARDGGSIPGSERSPGEGPGNSLRYSCLENPRDRGAWRAAVHRVTKESDSTEWQHTPLPLPSSCGAAPAGIWPSLFSWQFLVGAQEALSEGPPLCQSPCPRCCSQLLALCMSDVSQTSSGFLPRFALDPGEVTSPSVACVFSCSQ